MTRKTMPSELLESDTVLGLQEFCSVCGVSTELVINLVDEGIIEPVERRCGEPYFAAVSIRRVQVVRRLQRDLGVNRAGAGLALDLLDELHDLRARLQVLEGQFWGNE